jgi:ABC-2 type transport system permease protein
VSRLLRSEVRKVLTTKLWWGMLLGAMAVSALAVVITIASNGVKGNPSPPLTSAVTQKTLFASALSGYIFSVVVGIILMTTEYRHFTSRPTFLLEPRRGRVVAAKLIVSAGVGLLYGVLCVGITLATALPWLSAKGVTIDWTHSGVITSMIGALLVVAIFAVVGVGVGVLIGSQVAAVVSTLAYLFVVEPLLSLPPVVKEAYPYLPAAAGTALTGASRNGITLLPNWEGGLVLLGWGLLFAFLGWILTVRRDIP